jgi:hypothetical protein
MKPFEEMKTGRRGTFLSKGGVSEKQEVHEVLIAVKQLNADILQEFVLENSSPGNSKRKPWLTFDQVGDLIKNDVAYHAIIEWLDKEDDVLVTWTSRRREFIKVVAPIATWERLLHTRFHQYHFSDAVSHEKTYVNACAEYHLPVELHEHISSLFRTTQLPPEVASHKRKASPGNRELFKSDVGVQLEQVSGATTIALLKNVYKVCAVTFSVWFCCRAASPYTLLTVAYPLYKVSASVLGSTHVRQSVFETSNEFFSPQDLTSFQQVFSLPVVPAVDIGGQTTSTCDGSTPPVQNCDEGNLDIQYISGKYRPCCGDHLSLE